MEREKELQNWLQKRYPQRSFTLSFAAADADFRRYFRAVFENGESVVCMDAPPDKMSIEPYLRVREIFAAVHVPQVFHHDIEHGFAALEDFGKVPYLAALEHDTRPEVQRALLLDALDTLIELQKSSRPGVLDFQDALYGPITYDLVSLLRDAFIEWEEEFVIDLAVRYWEKARAADLPVPADFDRFYRDFEWMGVQRHLKVAGIFARLWHRDGKGKYRPEIPRFLNYLRRTARRYRELAPLYTLLLELVGDEELQTGYTF